MCCKGCKEITLLKGNGIQSTVDNGDGTFTITFTDGTTFTTSDFTGPAGLNGIDGADGADGASGVDMYDSGWIQMNDYDAGKGYGLPAYTSWNNPQLRVIGKSVFYEGVFMIPLSNDSDAGSTLLTDVSLYPTTNKDKVRVYEGASGGLITNNNGSLTSNKPVIPAALYPSLTHTINRFETSVRPVKNVADTHALLLSTIFPSITITTAGKVVLTTMKDLNDSALGGGAGSAVIDSPLHMLITKVAAADTAPTYSAFKTAYTATVDQRLSVDSTRVFPAAIDGKDETQVGGFYFKFTFVYPVDIAVTEAQLIAAIAEIQA